MAIEKISITVGDITVQAQLNESETARRILAILPVEGQANVWGEEIYFNIPLEMPEASDAREAVAVGDLGFWPQGNAFCIFFGPTPASTDETPRAYSPVNVFGQVLGDVTVLKAVIDHSPVRVTKASETLNTE